MLLLDQVGCEGKIEKSIMRATKKRKEVETKGDEELQKDEP